MAYTQISIASQDLNVAAPRKSVLLRWIANWEQRQDLSRLDPSALQDIGLSEKEAQIEARRPFWQS